jgi:PAS domain S-box-containing protein
VYRDGTDTDGPPLVDSPSFVVETHDDAETVVTKLADPDANVGCLVYEPVASADGTGWTAFLSRARDASPRVPIVVYTPGYDATVAVVASRHDGVEYVPGEPPAGIDADLRTRVQNLVLETVDAEEAARHRRTVARREAGRSVPDISQDDRVDRLLGVGCEYLGADAGFVTVVDETRRRLEAVAVHGDASPVSVGESLPIEETICRRTIEGDDLLGIRDVSTDDGLSGDLVESEGGGRVSHESDEGSREPAVGSYLGGRIDVDGELYGTICFVTRSPRPEPFTQRERTFVSLLAEWVAGELERQSYARALREERERAERVLDRVQDGFFAVDEEWSITYLNRRFEEIIGRGPGELLGENLWESFPEAVTKAFYDEYTRAMETGEPVQFEEYFDPLETWFDVRAYPSDDGLSVYFRDITEEKARERTLLRHEAIVEGIDDAVFVVDEEGRFEFLSPGDLGGEALSERLLGRQYTALRDGDVGPTATIEEFEAGIESVLRGDASEARLELTFETAGGRDRIIDLRLSRLASESAVDDTARDRGRLDSETTGVLGIARDVTGTREALRTLQRTTRALRDADSEAAVATHAVEAGLTVVEAAVGAVYLFDDDRGTLQPVTAARRDPTEDGTDAAVADVDIDVETLPAADTDSLPWTAFADGGLSYVAAVDPAASAFPAAAGVRSEFALPLGRHGVVVFGDTTTRPQSEARVEFARTLGASVEVALARLATQRTVREREQTLEAQTDELERLDRVNAVVRRTATAIVTETTRAELERELCERLVDIGPFAHVWIGEVAPGGDRLVERVHAEADWVGDRIGADGNGDGSAVGAGSGAVAGAGSDAGSSLDGGGPDTAPVGDDESPTERTTSDDDRIVTEGPAWAAVETGSVQVTESLLVADDGAERPTWQKRAAERGFQSCCAVPLVQQGTVRGVLKLYADRPAAFPESIRRVLSELGELIGYAVTSAERRAALQTSDVRELEMSVADSDLFVAQLARSLAAPVTLDRVDFETGRPRATYTVEGAVSDRELAPVAELAAVETVEAVATDASRTVLEVTLTDAWYGTAFTGVGGTVTDATVDAAGDGSLAVTLPTDVDVRTLVEPFTSTHPGVELAATRVVERSRQTPTELRETLAERLTDRQLAVLETAYERGYFEHPRSATGADLADELGIAQSTFNQHLRLAERGVFETLFDDSGPTDVAGPAHNGEEQGSDN